MHEDMDQDERTLLSRTPDRLMIGGRWVAASDGRTFPVLDPATGERLASVAAATPADGRRALDAAHEAAAAWAATAPRARAEILRRAWELLQERREDVALLITMEMGKPLAESRAEVAYGSEFLRWFAEEAVRVVGRYGTDPDGGGRMIVSHRPVGPALLITPWNFPLAMATRKVAPALAAGCTIVLKPAELTPLTALAFAEVLEEAGLPAGVLNVVTTDRPQEVIAPMMADPRLRKLSFTGSTAVGRSLLRQSADGMLRTSLELGGNAPFLVFDDADLDAAVPGAMIAKFRNMGQACTAANRFLVHESVVDQFTDRMVAEVEGLRLGRGTEPGVTIGPLIDDRAVGKARELVADAVAKGARAITRPGALPERGSFFAPAVVTGLPADARMVQEEIFSPVVGIIPFRDEEEGVRLANATPSGLAAYVYTRSVDRALRLVESVETGLMGVNTGRVSNAAAPFGGMKQSGLGREGGIEGIHEYLEVKYSAIPATHR